MTAHKSASVAALNADSSKGIPAQNAIFMVYRLHHQQATIDMQRLADNMGLFA